MKAGECTKRDFRVRDEQHLYNLKQRPRMADLHGVANASAQQILLLSHRVIREPKRLQLQRREIPPQPVPSGGWFPLGLQWTDHFLEKSRNNFHLCPHRGKPPQLCLRTAKC